MTALYLRPTSFTELLPSVPEPSEQPLAPLWPAEIVDLARGIDLAEVFATSGALRATIESSTIGDGDLRRTTLVLAGSDYGVESAAV